MTGEYEPGLTFTKRASSNIYHFFTLLKTVKLNVKTCLIERICKIYINIGQMMVSAFPLISLFDPLLMINKRQIFKFSGTSRKNRCPDARIQEIWENTTCIHLKTLWERKTILISNIFSFSKLLFSLCLEKENPAELVSITSACKGLKHSICMEMGQEQFCENTFIHVKKGIHLITVCVLGS